MLSDKEIEEKTEQMWDMADDFQRKKSGMTRDQISEERGKINALMQEINRTLIAKGEDILQWEVGHTPGSA